MNKTYGRRMFETLIGSGPDEAGALGMRYRLADDGVHLVRLSSHERQLLDPEEIAAYEAHPTGDFDEPALPFPFRFEQLVDFERTAYVVADRWVWPDGRRATDLLSGEACVLAEALLDVLDGLPPDEARRRHWPGEDGSAASGGRGSLEMGGARPCAPRRDWCAEARAQAQKILSRDNKRSLYPSQAVVADEIARDWRSRGIFGPSGYPLTGATIKRHALAGTKGNEPRRRGRRGNRGK